MARASLSTFAVRRRLSFLLVFVPALIATALFARALGDLLSNAFVPNGLAMFAPAAAPPSPPPPPPSKKRPLVVAEPPHAAPKNEAPSELPCAFGARVVLVALDEERPKRSLAVLAVPSATGVSKPLVQEGSVVSGRRVTAITSRRVWLEQGASTCYVDGVVRAETEAKPATLASPGIKGIAQVDDRHVRIDRALRDALLESAGGPFVTARVAPEIVGGKVVGVRVIAFPASSPLGKLGLRPGDVVKTINGYDLTSTEQALEAFARLRNAPRLEVALLRGGAPTSLTIEVV